MQIEGKILVRVSSVFNRKKLQKLIHFLNIRFLNKLFIIFELLEKSTLVKVIETFKIYRPSNRKKSKYR